MLYFDTMIKACAGATLVPMEDVPPDIIEQLAQAATEVPQGIWPIICEARQVHPWPEAAIFSAAGAALVPMDADGFDTRPLAYTRWLSVWFGPRADQALFFRVSP